VSAIRKNLISIHRFFYDNDCYFKMDANGFYMKDNKTEKVLLTGSSFDGLYHIQTSPSIVRQIACYGKRTTQDVWHARLGHPSHSIFTTLLNKYHIPLDGAIVSNKNYHICPLGKSCRLPFEDRQSHAQFQLALLHLDLWGPAPISSNFSYRYYFFIVKHLDLWGPTPISSNFGYHYSFFIVDDNTRFSWLYPLAKKSKVLTTFIHFKKLVEYRFSSHIKQSQIDDEGEFTSKLFLTFLRDHEISHQISCPYTPQQNGVVERKHRHIVAMRLYLLAQSRLPHNFWVEAFSIVVFRINRLPTPKLDHISPYEKLLQRTLDYTFLKSFGYACFPHMVPYNRHKLSFKSVPCVFIGYDDHYKGYRCLDPVSGRIYISRNVVLMRQTSPTSNLSLHQLPNPHLLLTLILGPVSTLNKPTILQVQPILPPLSLTFH
jgi:hypothetical protein